MSSQGIHAVQGSRGISLLHSSGRSNVPSWLNKPIQRQRQVPKKAILKWTPLAALIEE